MAQPVFLAELRGRTADALGEQGDEVAAVWVADLRRNLSDRKVGRRQQGLGMVDAGLDDEVIGRQAGHLLEQVGEVVVAQPRNFRKLVQGDLLPNVGADIGDGPVDRVVVFLQPGGAARVVQQGKELLEPARAGEDALALDIVFLGTIKMAAHGLVIKQALGLRGRRKEKEIGLGQNADFKGL